MIDFIIKILKSKDPNIKMKYYSILMIINELIKYFHLILFKEKYIIE